MNRSAFVLLVVAACGSTAKPPLKPPEPPVVTPVVRPPQRLQLTIVGGSIDGRKPDGAVWDDEGTAASPPELRGALAGYLAAHPELEGSSHLIGEPVDVPGVLRSARASSAPDPMVFVELEGKVFRTTLAPGQFQPIWRFPLVVTASPDSEAMARITVVDWDGPAQVDVIGDKLIPLRALAAQPVVELPRFGNVERLVIEYTTAGELAARRRVAVAGRDGWTDSGMVITAGQEVTVRAAGEVCSKAGDRSRCAGPEGQSRAVESNIPGFEARGHAGLVGAIGDTRFFLGREARFVAPSSGPLLLGVNDVDTGNNSGELEVVVETR